MQKTLTRRVNTRAVAVIGIMSAIAYVLMMLEFAIPSLIPSFVKLDLSELPALLTSFALGPIEGVAVCFIKNLLHLPFSSTSCVGELANFLVGAPFLLIAGFFYKKKRTRRSALLGALAGAIISALISFPVNLYISYPFYTVFMPEEAIIGMYSTILPAADSLPKALFIFNCPFTLIKFLLCSAISAFVYKPLSPLLKKTK